MSIEELKREIKELSEEERHLLASFLTELELDGDSGYWPRVRARLADESPGTWIDVDSLNAG